MVTMALIQGSVNTFVIFFSRVIGWALDKVVGKLTNGVIGGSGFGLPYFIISIIAEIVLSLLGAIVVMWFSRHREYKADIGGANFTSESDMIKALERLGGMNTQPLQGKMAAFGISGGNKLSLAELFSTHPTLEKRIKRLKIIEEKKLESN